jgi:hypothetical protein
MPAKRMPGSNKLECWVGRIVSWEAHVGLSVERSKSHGVRRSSHHFLTLKAELLEPIKGRRKVTLRLVRDEDASSIEAHQKREHVGHIWSITKNDVEIWIYVTDVAMSEILSLAACGRLASCSFVCQEPYRGRADIVNFAAGTIVAEEFESIS